MKMDSFDKDVLKNVVKPEHAENDSGFYIRRSKPVNSAAKVKAVGNDELVDAELYRIYKCGVPQGNFLIGVKNVENTVAELNKKRFCIVDLAVFKRCVNTKSIEVIFVKCVYDTEMGRIVYIHDNGRDELCIYKNILVVQRKKLVVHMPTMNVVYEMREPYGKVSMFSDNYVFVCDDEFNCKVLAMVNTENGAVREMQVG